MTKVGEKLVSNYLYLARLYNEEENFYKIGVTSEFETGRRFYQFPYKVQVAKCVAHESKKLLLDMERQCIKLCTPYTPLISFGGKTECVVCLKPARDFLDSLSWMRALEVNLELDTEGHLRGKRKKPNYGATLERYYNAVIDGDEYTTNDIETSYPDIAEVIHTVGIDTVAAYSFNWTSLKTKTKDVIAVDNLKAKDFKLKLDTWYPLSKIKSVVGKVYKARGITIPYKAVDIGQWYITRRSRRNKVEGYILSSK